jgi:2-polyprenyl-3-methyl-5-hydroxy-6-metoxy-1,4-benzoquinol methylase
MLSRIFISHSSHDQPWITDKVLPSLRDAGFLYWFSRDDLLGGEQWAREITRSLRESVALLLILSPSSVRSTWVGAELMWSLEHELPIVPVLKEPCDPAELNLVLLTIQYINFPDLGEQQGCERLIRQLAQTMKSSAANPVGSAPQMVSRPAIATSKSVPTVPETLACIGKERLFRMATLELPYIRLLGTCEPQSIEFYEGEVDVRVRPHAFALPPQYSHIQATAYTTRRCRFLEYELERVTSDHYQLYLAFEETSYVDYLRTGPHLDEPDPSHPGQTFRQAIVAAPTNWQDFSAWPLPNICGAGVFVITADDQVILSERSASVLVHPGKFSYSASGTINWDPTEPVRPFAEVARECREELRHDLGADVQLFAVGIDAELLYFQLTFFEQTARTADYVLQRSWESPRSTEFKRLHRVPFTVEALVPWIVQRSWEPAAAATLLTLLAKRYGERNVEEAIDPQYVQHLWTATMLQEWRKRAQRPGDLAVMSTRYPRHRIDAESQRYVADVLGFLGDEANGRDVLEVGGGVGRLTRPLAERASHVTCLDLCAEMLEQNRKRLGSLASSVTYRQEFIQQYVPQGVHDLGLVSQVLIHNVEPHAFEAAVRAIRQACRSVVLCEHIADEGRQTSYATHLRTREELLTAFQRPLPGIPAFQLIREGSTQVCQDKIILLRLDRVA